MSTQDLYQSILFQISRLPLEYLIEADAFLKQITEKIEAEKHVNTESIQTESIIDDESVWDDIAIEYREQRHAGADEKGMEFLSY